MTMNDTKRNVTVRVTIISNFQIILQKNSNQPSYMYVRRNLEISIRQYFFQFTIRPKIVTYGIYIPTESLLENTTYKIRVGTYVWGITSIHKYVRKYVHINTYIDSTSYLFCHREPNINKIIQLMIAQTFLSIRFSLLLLQLSSSCALKWLEDNAIVGIKISIYFSTGSCDERW